MSEVVLSPLAMPVIGGLARYAPPPVSGLNLADNTNLWGTPPAAVREIAAAAAGAASYPSLYGEALKAAAAESLGMSPEAIVTGCGSDNVLDAAMRAFAGAGRRVAFCAPTFVMVPKFATLAGATPVPLAFRPDGDIDADALLAADADITYVCAPNNPTGVQPSDAAVARVLERARGLVIIDEAYTEYSGRTWAAEAVAHGRLLVCRTMSKAYGMAGLRAGFGVARADVIAALERARGPYTLNALAERAAAAAVREDGAWIAEHARQAVATRERLAEGLRALGYAPLPSGANFLCVPVDGAGIIAARLRERGLLVRAFTALPGLGDALRITVGPWTIMQQLLDALAEDR
ncbi:MAG: histidinol-phosphate aminotransferase family protein [Gemmatimonadaceae bacterium]|nr:histidinol-phosphate aminotransferase family protein [Gemmatimonadaceae bacterium]